MQRLLQKDKIVEESQVDGSKEQEGKTKIKVFLSGLGIETQEVELTPGETLKDLLKAHKAEKMEVRVNKENVPLSTKLKDGDIVVVVIVAPVASNGYVRTWPFAGNSVQNPAVLV